MMEIIVDLDALTLRGSKLKEHQAGKAASLLTELYIKTADEAKVADYIMRFKAIVCQKFFEQALVKLKPENIESLFTAIRATEAYKKNINHAATTRAFIIAAVLVKLDMDKTRVMLMTTLCDVEKNGVFSPAVIDCFNKTFVDNCGIETLEGLGNDPWSNQDSKNRFFRFVQAIRSSKVTTVKVEKGEAKDRLEATSESVLASKNTEKMSGQDVPSNCGDPIPKTNEALAETLVSTLSTASHELNTLLATMRESYGTITILKNTINERDLQIKELREALVQCEQQTASLKDTISKYESVIAGEQAKVDDLTERLKFSLQMDEVAQNQEMLTLKTNLANSLKLEYADYINSKEEECNPDTFGALQGSLARTFKILRRHGISIE